LLLWSLLEHIFEKKLLYWIQSPCPSVRPSVPYFFAIFQPTIWKFWILREDYLSTRSTAGFSDAMPRSYGMELRLHPLKLRFFPYISSISEKQSMFFNWYHKVIVKYKFLRKSFSFEALEAAGSGSNLGFNYSHLEKQDKESFTEVVT
jgi:hypothetical protein